jgi:hypothetical protein
MGGGDEISTAVAKKLKCEFMGASTLYGLTSEEELAQLLAELKALTGFVPPPPPKGLGFLGTGNVRAGAPTSSSSTAQEAQCRIFLRRGLINFGTAQAAAIFPVFDELNYLLLHGKVGPPFRQLARHSC